MSCSRVSHLQQNVIGLRALAKGLRRIVNALATERYGMSFKTWYPVVAPIGPNRPIYGGSTSLLTSNGRGVVLAQWT